MNGKRLKRAVTAAALAVAVIFSASVPAGAVSLSDLKQQQANLKKRETEIDATLSKLKNDKTKKTEYRAALDEQIGSLEDEIDTEQKQIDGYDADIRKKQKEIAGKQSDVDADFAKLKNRVRALYLTGEASNLEIILNAKNIMDLADKSEILKVISEHDTGLMNRLRGDIDAIKTQKAAIDGERAAVVGQKTAREGNKRKLSAQSAEITKVIAEINADQKQAETDKAKNADAEKEASAAVDRWFAEHRSNTGGYRGTGNFSWPVPSCFGISSPFGSRWSGAEFHKGIDISGSGIYGAEVVAADGGTVAEAESGYGVGYLGCRDGGGYGNHIYIDHGNGFFTIYGHLSRVSVSTGQTVDKGQKIGNVGSSGSSTGAHLHFEIRKNGSAVNPMNYFSR